MRLLRVKLEWLQERSRVATPRPSSRAATSEGANAVWDIELPSSSNNQPSGSVIGMDGLPNSPVCRHPNKNSGLVIRCYTPLAMICCVCNMGTLIAKWDFCKVVAETLTARRRGGATLPTIANVPMSQKYRFRNRWRDRSGKNLMSKYLSMKTYVNRLTFGVQSAVWCTAKIAMNCVK